jgi:hypothetical protein
MEIDMALFDQEASTYDNWCKTPLGSVVYHLEKIDGQKCTASSGKKY